MKDSLSDSKHDVQMRRKVTKQFQSQLGGLILLVNHIYLNMRTRCSSLRGATCNLRHYACKSGFQSSVQNSYEYCVGAVSNSWSSHLSVVFCCLNVLKVVLMFLLVHADHQQLHHPPNKTFLKCPTILMQQSVCTGLKSVLLSNK